MQHQHCELLKLPTLQHLQDLQYLSPRFTENFKYPVLITCALQDQLAFQTPLLMMSVLTLIKCTHDLD